MVVDDNRDAADTLAQLLRLKGHEVRVAHDGISALELAKAYQPALVLLDIGMPGMDGYEVALTAAPATWPREGYIGGTHGLGAALKPGDAPSPPVSITILSNQWRPQRWRVCLPICYCRGLPHRIVELLQVNASIRGNGRLPRTLSQNCKPMPARNSTCTKRARWSQWV